MSKEAHIYTLKGDPYIKARILDDPNHELHCGVCGTVTSVLVVVEDAQGLEHIHSIRKESTIIGDTNYLGLTCGCYAKFHRQVAHIEDKIKSRSSNA